MNHPIHSQQHPWAHAALWGRNADLVFWLCFVALNTLLFLPLTLMNLGETTVFPFEPGALAHPRQALTSLFLWRENTDPFRLNLELLILVALWVNVAWLRRGPFRWAMMLLYCSALLYYSYEGIMVSLYKVEPVFYNHYFMIRDGLGFLTEHLHISAALYAIVFTGVALLVAVVIITLRTLSDAGLPARLSRATRISLTALAVAGACVVVAYRGVSADPRLVVSSLALKLEKNISASVALYQSVTGFDDTYIRQAYDYNRHHLARRPNIYLIFVESYGSVLYKRPDWKIAYTAMAERTAATLNAGGFHVASALSEAPTWGGGSWMAYTSAIFGLRMDNHPHYLALLERYQTIRYPDLGTYLRSQGYYYTWITSISVELRESMWQQYLRFYGVDRWVRYKDLNYIGPHYGWGPAPSDQYVLAYVHEELLKDVEQPLLTFFITQNSHYPWDPLPTLVDDWRDLNVMPADGGPQPSEALDHDETRRRYLASIDYSLEMLTDFILNHADEDAIFILIGDHQPPRVSRRNDGYDTPIHIVSRNARFIRGLRQYGFVPGMVVENPEPAMRHEGLYSLLVRNLVANYGVRRDAVPPYLPDGVTPPNWDELIPAEE